MSLRASQDDEPYERIHRGFREYTGDDKSEALLVVLVVAVALLGLILWTLFGRDPGGTRRLFRRLCDASGLTPPERRLLQAVAVRAGAEHPPSLFFRKELFEGAAADMAADPVLLDSLRRKVYEP